MCIVVVCFIVIVDIQNIFVIFHLICGRRDLDSLLPACNKEIPSNGEIVLKPSTKVYYASCRFLSLFKEQSPMYTERLERLCRYLLASLESESPKLSYIGVALNKDLSITWIRHMKLLLYKCCICMEKLKPGMFCQVVVSYFPLQFINESIFLIICRNSFRESSTGIIFTYIGFIYITKYMGNIKSEKFNYTKTRNVTIVQ